jgi:hypothetical protein
MFPPVDGFRAIRFGGLDEGAEPVILVCRVEELLPL